MLTELECVRCHHINRDTARFCEACGERLAPTASEPATELRQGTVLFCDLTGSARLSTLLDPDALIELYRRYYEFVSSVARQHFGFLNRTEGDSGQLLFGYPTDHEDSARNALAAGLQLVREVADQVPVPGQRLALKVGVASGMLVIAGTVKQAMTKEIKLHGPVPDRGARLVSLAGSGAVLVDAATRRLAAGFFAYRDHGVHALKNIAEPVRVWEASAETSVVSRFDALAGRGGGELPHLVDREAERERLTQAWAETRRGRSSVAWISGEAGIGKSLLARHAATEAGSNGAHCLEIHCSARGERSPLFPVAYLVRELAGIVQADDSSIREAKARRWLEELLGQVAVKDALSCLAPMFGLTPDAETNKTAAEAVRERRIAWLLECGLQMARRGPLVLVCEDLHWADATTVEFLVRLMKAGRDLVLWLVVTSRQAPPSSVTDSPGWPTMTAIELGPLDNEHAAELVCIAADGAAPSADEVNRIVVRAEGLPLVIEELMSSGQAGVALDSPLDAPRPARSASTQLVSLALNSVVQSRLDRVPSLRPAMQSAAVLGREFSTLSLVRTLGGMDDAAQIVPGLVDLGLLHPGRRGGVDVLRFGHALIQQSVYQSMLPSQRRQLHSRVADLLRAGQGEVDEGTPEVIAEATRPMR